VVTKNRMLVSPQVVEVLNSIATANEITVPAALRMLTKAYARGDFRLSLDDLPIAPKPGDPNAPILFDGKPGLTVRDPRDVDLTYLYLMVQDRIAAGARHEYHILQWLIEILTASKDRIHYKDEPPLPVLTLPASVDEFRPAPKPAKQRVIYEGLVTGSGKPEPDMYDPDWVASLGVVDE